MRIMRGLAAIGTTVLVLGVASWTSTGSVYDCSAAEDRLGAALAQDPLFTAPPAGVERVSVKIRPCDEDDGHVEVAGRYRPAPGVPDAEQRFRASLDGHGWRARPSERGAARCWSKETAGTTAYLRLKRSNGRGLAVVLYADRQGTEWC